MFSTIVPKEKTDLFLAALRKATSPMHEKLEQTTLSGNLLKTNASLDDYISYLKAMHGVVAFCEATVFPIIAFLLPDINERRKLHLLENDLSFFNSNNARNFPIYQPFEKAGTGFALGYMYVIEGSTLGGRVIVKQLAPALSVTESLGGKFFAGYKEETGNKWKTFITPSAAWAVENNCEQEMIGGAQHAFETIYKHFEQ